MSAEYFFVFLLCVPQFGIKEKMPSKWENPSAE